NSVAHVNRPRGHSAWVIRGASIGGGLDKRLSSGPDIATTGCPATGCRRAVTADGRSGKEGGSSESRPLQLDRETELHRLRLRSEPERAAIGDPVAALERLDGLQHLRCVRRPLVGAALEETLVAIELVWPIAGQRLEEVLARPWPQVERARPQER